MKGRISHNSPLIILKVYKDWSDQQAARMSVPPVVKNTVQTQVGQTHTVPALLVLSHLKATLNSKYSKQDGGHITRTLFQRFVHAMIFSPGISYRDVSSMLSMEHFKSWGIWYGSRKVLCWRPTSNISIMIKSFWQERVQYGGVEKQGWRHCSTCWRYLSLP